MPGFFLLVGWMISIWVLGLRAEVKRAQK